MRTKNFLNVTRKQNGFTTNDKKPWQTPFSRLRRPLPIIDNDEKQPSNPPNENLSLCKSTWTTSTKWIDASCWRLRRLRCLRHRCALGGEAASAMHFFC